MSALQQFLDDEYRRVAHVNDGQRLVNEFLAKHRGRATAPAGSGVKRAAGASTVAGRRQSRRAQDKQSAPLKYERPSEQLTTRLVDGVAKQTVRFTRGTLADIGTTCLDWGEMADAQDIEAGGWLLGHWADLRNLTVTADAGSGISTHKPHQIALGWEHGAMLIDQRIAAERAPTFGTTTLCGWWHSHPSGNPLPSNVDMNSWARLMRHLREASYETWAPAMLGVIATTNEQTGGWGSPKLTAYVCTADPIANWRYLVQRAEIIK